MTVSASATPAEKKSPTETLRIGVVVNGFSRLQGGLYHSVGRLWQDVSARGATVVVHTIEDDHTAGDSAAYRLAGVVPARPAGPRSFNYAPGFLDRLMVDAVNYDVLSNHGMWTYAAYAAMRASAARRIPLMIHPEGMLDPWALRFGAAKKRAVRMLFQDRAFRQASCVRALCGAELGHIRAFGLRHPVAVIPNGIDLEPTGSTPQPDAIAERFPALAGRRRMLFMSRIHPKKGIANLLRAWRTAGPAAKDWVLVIAGPPEIPAHERDLRALAADLGIGDSVLFTGPLHGEAKREALAGAHAYTLPSFSEGFSIALLEAAAAGLPVLLTKTCYFPELARAGGGIECEATESSITGAMRELLAMDDAQRAAMGARGRVLVARDYTWDRIADDMRSVCLWLAGGGDAPGCVVR